MEYFRNVTGLVHFVYGSSFDGNKLRLKLNFVWDVGFYCINSWARLFKTNNVVSYM